MTAMYKHQKEQFDVDLWHDKKSQGEAFERRVIDLLRSHGHDAWKPTARSYDLVINLDVPLWGSHQVTGECKFDAMAAKTNRLALQTWDGGKPRGIHPKASNPDLWIHGIGDEVWIIKTGIVQELVQTMGLAPVASGDPAARAKCVLLPIERARKLVGGTWLSL